MAVNLGGSKKFKAVVALELEKPLVPCVPSDAALERRDKDRCDEDPLMLPGQELLTALSIFLLCNRKFLLESSCPGGVGFSGQFVRAHVSNSSTSALASESCERFHLVPAS